MDASQFDRIAIHLGRTHLSRRTALKSGVFGAVAAIATTHRGAPEWSAAATPTAPATPPSEVQVEDAWLCKQRYGLCTTAPCELSKTGPTIANCRCLVEDGYSMGYTSCADRVPEGDKLVSTFSTQNVTSSFHFMDCPAGDSWANCLDYPCEVDPDDPAKAICQCEVVKTGQFLTIGGDCDVKTCSSVLWSGAAPTLQVASQYQTAMKQIGQGFVFPGTCPGATPAASPTSA